MSNFKAMTSLCACLAIAAQSVAICPAHGSASTSKDKTKPTGTLLLPLTPKMGQIPDSLSQEAQKAIGKLLLPMSPKMDETPRKRPTPATTTAAGNNAAPASTKSATPAAKPAVRSAKGAAPAVAPQREVPPVVATPPKPPSEASDMDAALGNGAPGAGQSDISAEMGDDPAITDDTLLKGTVQITADDTEYDQTKNTFLGTGNAVAIIAGQNSKLEADTILYDQNSQNIDARGNVKITRDGQLTTGSSFKFKVTSDEYMITDPDTEIQGTTVVARSAKGTRTGIMFRKGDFTLPHPIQMQNNAFWGPLSAVEEALESKIHPDAYVPRRQSFKFKARKMIYERYKDTGNLTVFGGRAVFDNFTLPMPHFTATVGQENTRVVFPVTPLIGNNMMVGGVNVGPQFNYAVGKTGAFSWAPLIQFGGRTSSGDGTNNNAGKVGAGFKIGYSNDRLSTHIGYGSVSDILVGDFKYRFSQKTQFQSGINRFLNDGLFGMRRARLIAEVVDTRNLKYSIPGISSVTFRTSAGWAQDNPSLVNLSGTQYAQLFTPTQSGKVSAYRLQEQIYATTHPLFALGDNKYGANLVMFGGVAARAYSTGDSMLMGQIGPVFTAKMNRTRMQLGYTQSGVSGQSPFVFDQFIQGSRSVMLAGDVKISKWLTLGTNIGYNLVDRMMYSRAVTAAIGPEDFKFMVTRDFISGVNRCGFSLIYGGKVGFDKMLMKVRPDAGQTGGI